MPILEDFRSLGFPDQVSLLGQVQQQGGTDALDALFDLLAAPLGDEAVDTLVRNCLRTLLPRSEEHTLRGMVSPDPNVRTLCRRVAAESGFEAAGPLLAQAAGAPLDEEDLLDILHTMAQLAPDDFRDAFRAHMDHPSALVAGLCMRTLARLGDEGVATALIHTLDNGPAFDETAPCDLWTWNAIEALGTLATPQAIDYLADHIHLPNPTARRLLHEALVRLGERAVERVARELDAAGDPDHRIMAANVLGNIGHTRCANPLLAYLDNHHDDNHNVTFAAYEALGKVSSMKSLVRLADALVQERDPLLLTAVVTGLDALMSPALADQVITTLKADPEQAGRAIDAAVAARAGNVFEALFQDEELGERFLQAVAATRSAETIQAFSARLETRQRDPASVVGLDFLRSRPVEVQPGRLLAVDDSTAMRAFYRSVSGALGMHVAVAADGQQALETLQTARGTGDRFEVLVVDINMPVMDGVELARRVRDLPGYAETPIVMATTENTRAQRRAADTAGVTAFLHKPFSSDELKETIDRLR